MGKLGTKGTRRKEGRIWMGAVGSLRARSERGPRSRSGEGAEGSARAGPARTAPGGACPSLALVMKGKTLGNLLKVAERVNQNNI